MENELKNRSEVPVELTWDLTALYENESLMQEDLERVQRMAADLAARYKGKLNTAAEIDACMTEYQRVFMLLLKAENYSDLGLSVDYYNAHNQDVNGRVMGIASRIRSELSFVESEIKKQDTAVLEAAISAAEKAASGNAGYLKRLLKEKAHTLDSEAERVLAALGRTVSAPYEIYNNIKLADITFPAFTAGGREYPLGYSLFEDTYEYVPETEVRRNAFRAFSDRIAAYANGTATAYNICVQTEKTMAELRGYDSVFSYLLDRQNVTHALYNRQIDLIMEKLAPHMRKYAGLLQRVHKLDRMTYADLKLPVDPDYSPAVSIAEAKEYVLKGLSVLGPEYGRMIEQAFEERWVDFAQNNGKTTGGFCASPYGSHSYILLSWNEKMSDVFTLAHELGHAGHFKLCNEAQSLFDTDVSSYFVESPSTMNELLMTHYMLKTSDDKRFRRWVLSNMISNTYYHNFVTHLLEAAYQREVYRRVDAGENLQADGLSAIFKEVLEKFWGDAVELTPGAELTWMRQPHYYMGLYSYTYSAGLTIATQMCDRIEREGEPAVADWKEVLRLGSTLDPVGLAARAGIDITTDEPLLQTIETIGRMIDEICELTEELG